MLMDVMWRANWNAASSLNNFFHASGNAPSPECETSCLLQPVSMQAETVDDATQGSAMSRENESCNIICATSHMRA